MVTQSDWTRLTCDKVADTFEVSEAEAETFGGTDWFQHGYWGIKQEMIKKLLNLLGLL